MQTSVTIAVGIGTILAIGAEMARAEVGFQWPLADWRLEVMLHDAAVEEAACHFRQRAHALGAPEPRSEGGRVLRCTRWNELPESQGLVELERQECFAIAGQGDDVLVAGGPAPAGIAHAIGELEQRLRVRDGRVWLAFPEWTGPTKRQVFEKPAVAERGEYLNIGYDLPGITPHRWDTARWSEYLDRLALARLNRFYFFLWIDAYAISPKSTLASKPLNRQLHENLREAIRYAHRRGLKVTFMVTPTFLPRDIWDAHPEMHADIEYVQHGFPCVCPRAPGAWDLMRDVWRAEMEWFREADAVQIWFYDPGGCWCQARGCREHQAEILAREVHEFGGLFRQFHPNAEIQYNLWPLSLWETRLKVKVREELAQRVRALFPEGAVRVTAIGTPEGSPAPVPDLERRLGMQGGVFLFATNPETGYVFPIPHLSYLRRTAGTVKTLGVESCFGHRLEAGTRYLGTYLMGKWLWNPNLSEEVAVRQFADWQTADAESGRKLAEAIRLLEIFTVKGADAEVGRRLDQKIRDCWTTLPEACRADLEYWPATAAALRAIGDSLGARDEQLGPYAERFREAIRSSKTFAPLEPSAAELFARYRGLVIKGWEQEHF